MQLWDTNFFLWFMPPRESLVYPISLSKCPVLILCLSRLKCPRWLQLYYRLFREYDQSCMQIVRSHKIQVVLKQESMHRLENFDLYTWYYFSIKSFNFFHHVSMFDKITVQLIGYNQWKICLIWNILSNEINTSYYFQIIWI